MEEMNVRDGHVEKVASKDGWATPLAPSSLAFAWITTVSNRQRDHHFYSLLGRCLSWANEGGGEGKDRKSPDSIALNILPAQPISISIRAQLPIASPSSYHTMVVVTHHHIPFLDLPHQRRDATPTHPHSIQQPARSSALTYSYAHYQVEHSRRTLDPKDAEGSLRDFDLDAPLTEVGFAQADALGQYWAPL